MKSHLIIIILLLSFFIYQINTDNTFFNSPDESIQAFYSEVYKETGKTHYPADSEKYSEYIRPRGTLIHEGKIVPLKFIGFSYLLGTLSTFLDNFLYLLTPFLASLILLVIYSISKEITNKKAGIISMALLAFYPFFWYWANHSFFENIITTFFFLMGYLYLIKGTKNITSKKNYLLASIFFSISVSIRYDILIPLFFMVLPFLPELVKKLKIKTWIYCIILFILFVSPILIMNNDTYGGPFIYAQKILSDNSDIVPKYFENVSINLMEIFKFFPLILFVLPGIIGSIFKGNKLNRKTSIGLILYFLAFCYIYLSEFPPRHSYVLHESFTRYFLIFYTLSVIYISSFLVKMKINKFIYLFITIFIIFSIVVSAPYISWQWKSMESNKDSAYYVYNNTPQNAIIVLQGSDKFIYPGRETISTSHFKEENKEINYSKMAEILLDIGKTREIYIYAKYFNIDQLNSHISDEGGELYNKGNNIIFKLINKDEN